MPTSRSTPTERGADRRRPSAGITLLELIIVMMILSALFGIGVGAFRNLTAVDQLAVGQVEDALRAARLFARGEAAPAKVIVSPGDRRVSAVGLRRVGNWHFEDLAGTGWPRDILHDGGRLVPGGFIGSALELDQESVLLLASPPPGFDSPHGFGVDVAVRPRAGYRPMTILERVGVWRLELDESDSLRAAVQLRSDDPDAAAGATEEFRRDLGVRLPEDRFTRVTLVCDGRTLHVALDGVRVGDDVVFPSLRALPVRGGASLSSGKPPHHFHGQLDELHVWSAVTDDRGELPEEVELLGGERVVHLDRHGRLDPAFHRTPVALELLSVDPPRLHTLTLGLLGTTTRSVGPAPAPTAGATTPQATAVAGAPSEGSTPGGRR